LFCCLLLRFATSPNALPDALSTRRVFVALRAISRDEALDCETFET